MKSILVAGILLFTLFVSAQHHEIHDKPTMYKGKHNSTDDTTSLLHAFKAGVVHGHFRYYFMHTNNEANLTDYYANAAGGGIRYETAEFKHFQFAVSGFYFFNIGSSKLAVPDPVTGQSNRYEIGLFDMEDPHNHKDMDRLEELYLKYNFKKSHLTFGRQLINTPLINLQDGRMRPTGVEGIWFDWNQWKHWKLEGGFIYAISPRSTTKWFSVGESIGLYPTGVDSSGVPSQYKHHSKSAGVGILGIHFKKNNWYFQVWDYFTENIFNTAFAQLDWKKENKSKKWSWMNGVQFIRQDAVGQGGNDHVEYRYIQKGTSAMTLGARTGMQSDKWRLSLNYNRITSDGAFLNPREWGRDPFYTFMPRERNEGFGNVHAFVVKAERKWKKQGLKSQFTAGYFQLPDVKDYRLNKYGVPSYYQINLDTKYEFKNFFKGLEAQMLFVFKINAGETYNNPKYVFNKVNMGLVNLVLNYHF